MTFVSSLGFTPLRSSLSQTGGSDEAESYVRMDEGMWELMIVQFSLVSSAGCR